ncbi:MAG: exodeoxyribonuclease VII large subunit [Arcanobacterium sp.]|nr:exodeoxyribonuclease VII large subunit [Arcanobacterium sp.]
MATAVPIPPELPQTAAQTTPEQPWPVRLLSAKVVEYVARMSRMWIEGEITSLQRRPGSKVQFFTLSDLKDDVKFTCKMWSHALPSGIDKGARVVALVKPEFWKGGGSFSLHVDELRPVGIGEILARLEALKATLAAEGLFAPERKKPLPFLPKRIGLICGRNTDAMHDVIKNATQQWPAAQFEIREVRVQGQGAVEAVMGALAELDSIREVEVIIIARGGGSIEDLLPFSDERLIRAVGAAHTPVVSAIGHETHNPLLELVADFRASTPTEAAKNVVPNVAVERESVSQLLARGRRTLDSLITEQRYMLSQLRQRPALSQPSEMIDARAADVAYLRNWAQLNFSSLLEKKRGEVQADIATLRTLSPRSTLRRGYSILRGDDGSLIRSIHDATAGADVVARVYDGDIDLQVKGR